MNRREFVRKMSRNVLVGSLLAGGAYLLLKPETGESCNFDFICKNCKQLKDCKLPEADQHKANNNKTTK